MSEPRVETYTGCRFQPEVPRRTQAGPASSRGFLVGAAGVPDQVNDGDRCSVVGGGANRGLHDRHRPQSCGDVDRHRGPVAGRASELLELLTERIPLAGGMGAPWSAGWIELEGAVVVDVSAGPVPMVEGEREVASRCEQVRSVARRGGPTGRDRGECTGCVADDHRRCVGHGRSEDVVGETGIDRLRRSEEVEHRVHLVDAHLDEDAALRTLGGPMPGVGPHVGRPIVREISVPDPHLSGLAPLDPLLRRPVARQTPCMVRHSDRDADLGGHPHHLEPFGDVDRERLVHQHRLPRGQGGEDMAGVEVVGGGEHHPLDSRILEQLVEGSGRPVDSVLAGEGLPVLRCAGEAAHEAHEVAPVRRRCVCVRPPAEADDPESDCVSHRCSSRRVRAVPRSARPPRGRLVRSREPVPGRAGPVGW